MELKRKIKIELNYKEYSETLFYDSRTYSEIHFYTLINSIELYRELVSNLKRLQYLRGFFKVALHLTERICICTTNCSDLHLFTMYFIIETIKVSKLRTLVSLTHVILSVLCNYSPVNVPTVCTSSVK